MKPVAIANEEAIEAWNGVLFERFVKFRAAVTTGLGAHGEAGLRLYPPAAGQRVLDIGCGFGDTTQMIARLVGPEGAAVGIDAAERFIDTARAEAERDGVANARFVVGDVEVMDFDERFDLAYSRFGTMFFANPVAALRRVRAALAPGGRLCMVVWRQKLDNEWVHRAELIAERYLTHPDQTDEPTCGPGPFAMANADTVSQMVLGAGYEEVTLHRFDFDLWMGADLDQAIDLALAIGPAAELVRLNGEAGERVRPRIVAELREALADCVVEDGVRAASSSWIVAARAPG